MDHTREGTTTSGYLAEIAERDGAVPYVPQEGSIAFAVTQLEQALIRVDKESSMLGQELTPVLGHGGEDKLATGVPQMHDPAPMADGIMEQVRHAHELADRLFMLRERLRIS